MQRPDISNNHIQNVVYVCVSQRTRERVRSCGCVSVRKHTSALMNAHVSALVQQIQLLPIMHPTEPLLAKAALALTYLRRIR